MVVKAIGKFASHPRSKSSRVQIPAKMVWDSAFPLEEGTVEITVEGKSLIIIQYEANARARAATEAL